LILIENAGFSPAFIYEAEGFVLKRFIFFAVKSRRIYITNILLGFPPVFLLSMYLYYNGIQ